MAKVSLRVNGKNLTVDAEPDMPLLYALRNDLRLNGPKFGCGLAQCGACTVIRISSYEFALRIAFRAKDHKHSSFRPSTGRRINGYLNLRIPEPLVMSVGEP